MCPACLCRLNRLTPDLATGPDEIRVSATNHFHALKVTLCTRRYRPICGNTPCLVICHHLLSTSAARFSSCEQTWRNWGSSFTSILFAPGTVTATSPAVPGAKGALAPSCSRRHNNGLPNAVAVNSGGFFVVLTLGENSPCDTRHLVG